jgi:hypothetical protein
MNKKTKMYIGVGVVAVAAYYFWKKSQDAKATATVVKKDLVGADGVFANAAGCPAGYSYSINSNKVAVCDNGKGHRYKTRPIQ